jgi:hypothetical protein
MKKYTITNCTGPSTPSRSSAASRNHRGYIGPHERATRKLVLAGGSTLSGSNCRFPLAIRPYTSV